MEEHKSLEIRHNALMSKHNEKEKEMDHTGMNAEDIAKWIIGLDVDRYSHYYAKIVANMEKEGIDGNCLDELEKEDLYRLGITKFKDKRDVLKKIKEFVQQSKLHQKSHEGLIG